MATKRLSEPESAFYARVYDSARAGSMAELRKAGCGEDEAEEIFSDAYVEAMHKIDPISAKFAEAQMVNLLKGICRWRLIDRRRHDGSIPFVPLTDACSVNGTGTDEAAADREALKVILGAVHSLPRCDQQVYLSRMLQGLCPEQIQLLVGLSPRSYRKRFQRANKRVSAALIERGIQPRS